MYHAPFSRDFTDEKIGSPFLYSFIGTRMQLVCDHAYFIMGGDGVGICCIPPVLSPLERLSEEVAVRKSMMAVHCERNTSNGKTAACSRL
jgi:hypothetical protein